MSLEENKAVVRRAIEALNKQDLSLLYDLVAPNHVPLGSPFTSNCKPIL